MAMVLPRDMEKLVTRQWSVPETGPSPVTFYVNSSKDRMYEIGEALGLKGEALSTFAYTASEVEIIGRVDRASGRMLATKINGIQVGTSEAIGGIPV